MPVLIRPLHTLPAATYVLGMPTLSEIRSDFGVLDDWEDRYRYVIELGRALPPLPEAARTEANRVRGCASQVWLASEVRLVGFDTDENGTNERSIPSTSGGGSR